MTAREGRSATLTEGRASRPSLSSYTTWRDTTQAPGRRQSGRRSEIYPQSKFALRFGGGESG